ncbi:sulfatase [Mycobacterium tuberculosis]|nr:sulfatase [Mycobacterium tuberculosis]
MSEDNALVLVAGYQDLDSARHDFQTLVDAAKDKSIPLQGAVLIGKDAEGSPVLVDTGNRLGRRGAAWLAAPWQSRSATGRLSPVPFRPTTHRMC